MRLEAVTAQHTVVNRESLGAVRSGESYTLRLGVFNLQRDSLRAAQITLSLPPQTVFENAQPAGFTLQDSLLTAALPSLAGGDSLVYELHFRLREDFVGPDLLLTHTAHLAAPGDIHSENDSATVAVLARAPQPPAPSTADLQLQLLFTEPNLTPLHPDTLLPAGATVGVLLRLTNGGPDTARLVELTATVPAFPGGTQWQPLPVDSAALKWTFPELAPGATVQVLGLMTLPQCPESTELLRFSAFVQAENDTVLQNNAVSREAQTLPPDFDLAPRLAVAPDTTVMVHGSAQPALFRGSTHTFAIAVHNFGRESSCPAEVRLIAGPGAEIGAGDAQWIQGESTLVWPLGELAAGDSLQLPFVLTLTAGAPDSITLLAVTRAALDQHAENDTSQITLWITPRKAAAAPHLDLEITLSVQTDTTVEVTGGSVPAVQPGGTFALHLVCRNLGPNEADSFAVRLTLPELLMKLTLRTIARDWKDGDLVHYVWYNQHLAPDSIWTADAFLYLPQNVSRELSELPFTASVEAAGDTNSANDSAAAVVRILHDQVLMPDLAVRQYLQTGHFTTFPGDTLWIAEPGESYRVAYEVVNRGTGPAVGLRLTARWSEGITWEGAEPPATARADSAAWLSAYLIPGDTLRAAARFRAPEESVPGIYRLAHEFTAAASNEPTDRRSNNREVDSLFVAVSHELPQPQITATPEVATVGDSVFIGVMVPVRIARWELRVLHADGEVDSTYADDFLAQTDPEPGQWYEVHPPFTDTRLTTGAREEPLVFELHIWDELGFHSSNRVSVTVRSANAFTLDRNVFQPATDGRLALRFKLSSRRLARLDLFDLAGQHITRIAEGIFEPDWNTYYWDGRAEDGREVGSGVYIVLLRSGEFQSWKKVILVR